MNIMAPVNTFQSAVAYISAGAKELYLGGDEGLYNTFSFTGRGKYGYNGQKVLSNFEEVKEIVRYAHHNGVKVNFLCNNPFFCDGFFMGKSLEHYLFEYIEKGIEAGIDSLVVSDLGIASLLKKKRYPIEIHASVYFRTINEQQLLFLKSLGVKRAVLSYHITLDEIKTLSAANILDIEVIGYLGCSFFNGACNFLHDYGEGVIDDFDPGVTCKGKFTVKDESRVENIKIFDFELGCALCMVGELEKAGVKTLKIVGRERNYQHLAKVVELYCRFLDYYRRNLNLDDINKEIPAWWRKIWCSKKRCKFKNVNNNYQYLIGE